jgi:hypothetical protein
MSGSFATTAVWGLIVLSSFTGWGGALAACLFRKRQIDIGLSTAWGMAFTVVIGGPALLFNLASREVLIAFVVLGCVLALSQLARALPSSIDIAVLTARWKARPGSALLLGVCVGAALLQYVFSVCNLRFNPNDDFVAYFPFARQILEQGTLFDPFSTRRALSFGGHSLLHAIVLAGSASYRLHMLDQGICVLIAVLLVIGSRKEAGSTEAGRFELCALLAVLLLLTLPDIRVNTHSEMSGVVLFYGLYRTLIWLVEAHDDRSAVANAAVVALLASAICTLRSNYIAACLPMIALSYAHFVWIGDGMRRQRLREALWATGFVVVFLVCWMTLSYRSSGTPLFPILQGHFNDSFTILQRPGQWQEQLADFVRTVMKNRLMPTFPLLFLASALLPDRAARRPLRSLFLGGAIAWVMLVHTIASDVPSAERYVYGFLVTGAIAATTGIAFSSDAATGWRATAVRVGRTMAAAGALGQLVLVGAVAVNTHEAMVRTVMVLARVPIRAPELMPLAARYRVLQSQVPEGASLLIMVDHPFLFDFKRNDIFNVDTAAAVSPPPGFPYFRGPDAVATYLRGQSIRYLVFVRPEQSISLYRRDHWKGLRNDPESIWHPQAAFYLDVFDNFENLASSRLHLYDDGTFVLLDLEQPHAIKPIVRRPRLQM